MRYFYSQGLRLFYNIPNTFKKAKPNKEKNCNKLKKSKPNKEKHRL